MPIEYLTGEWNFQDITLKLVPPIFVPWPETENFVEFLLKRLSSLHTDNCEILEIGCGSGVISVAVAHNYRKVCEMIILLFLYPPVRSKLGQTKIME